MNTNRRGVLWTWAIMESLRRESVGLRVPMVGAGSALVASTFLGSALGFAYWLVAARLFPPRDVGFGAAVVSAMTVTASFSLCGLNFVAGRFLPVAGARQPQLTRDLMLAAVGLSAAGSMAFVAGSPLWAPSLVAVSWPLFGASILWAVFMVQDSILLGVGMANLVPVKNGLFGLAKLGLLWFAARSLGLPGWAAVAAPWFVASAAGMLAVWGLLAKPAFLKGRRTEDARVPQVASLARFALANHFAAILLQLPGLVYPLLVLQSLGPSATAYFYTSWMIANLLMLASSNIASAMVTQAAREEAELRALVLVGLRYAMLLVAPGVIGVIVFGRVILSAFGAEYLQGYALLVTMALGALVYVPNSLYAGLVRVRCRLRAAVIQGAVAGAVSLVLALPLAQVMGLTGFGVAFLAGQFAAAVAVFSSLLDHKPHLGVNLRTRMWNGARLGADPTARLRNARGDVGEEDALCN